MFRERLESALKELEALRGTTRAEGEALRLAGKVEGVKLALSYLDEGYVVMHKELTREDCLDPWVCCVHYLTQEERARA